MATTTTMKVAEQCALAVTMPTKHPDGAAEWDWQSQKKGHYGQQCVLASFLSTCLSVLSDLRLHLPGCIVLLTGLTRPPAADCCITRPVLHS